MESDKSVFDITYEDYLERLSHLNLEELEERLGVQVEGDVVTIPLYGKPFTVSSQGIQDPTGKRPALTVCVILSKYLLMCPPKVPEGHDWVSYRDFRDSGPLTTYFTHDVEQAIAHHFAGKRDLLQKASGGLGALAPDMEVSYDLSFRFDALPRVPVLMLFNDRDEEFPATCSVLFEKCADCYLDPESLGMLGSLLFAYLKRSSHNKTGTLQQ